MRALVTTFLSLMSLAAVAQTQPRMDPTPALGAWPQDQVVRPQWQPPPAGGAAGPAYTTPQRGFGSSLGADAADDPGNSPNLGRYDSLGFGRQTPADADARCKAQQAGQTRRNPGDADPCRR